MGHSAISAIFRGETGPTGPKGSRGITGPIGTGTGLTGITGLPGIHIRSLIATPNNTVLFKSDNTSLFLDDTRGSDGYTGSMYGENKGTGFTLYSATDGFTLSVRGLTFIGNLSAQVTAGTILITPIDVYYGVTLAPGIINNRVVYSKSVDNIDTTRIQLGKADNNFIFSNTEGITSGSSSVYSEMSGNIIQIPSGGNNIILGLTLGSIYHIHTPIGITGFTLDSSSYGDKEIISFTFLVEGSGFTQFPSNVHFENSPYSSVFGCGMNIMNLLTYDKGQNWFATITDRGYGVNGCSESEAIGSCCYSGISGNECVEYVTEARCTELIGTFNALTPCSDIDCPSNSMCCSNGYCVSNVSREECEYFGGQHFSGITCDGVQYPPEAGNGERLCYDFTKPPYSCCTGGQCIPNVTASLCFNYYKGLPFPGECCDINCVSNPPQLIYGACCIRDSSSPGCTNTTARECAGITKGVFHGAGTSCEDPNLQCCLPPQTGSCCDINGGCTVKTQAECTGTWTAGESCTPNPCEQPNFLERGLCCQTNSCTSNVTRQQCLTSDPNARYFPNIVFNGNKDRPYKWTNGDCYFCDVQRYALLVGTEGSNPSQRISAFDLAIFNNRPTGPSPNADETDNTWSPRYSINPNSSLYQQGQAFSVLRKNLYLGLSGGVETYLYPDCGYVSVNSYQNDKNLLLIDSFLAGQIWTRRMLPGGVYPNKNYASYPIGGATEDQFNVSCRTFIYQYYLSNVAWVLGDYMHKILNGPTYGDVNALLPSLYNSYLPPPNNENAKRNMGWKCCKTMGPACTAFQQTGKNSFPPDSEDQFEFYENGDVGTTIGKYLQRLEILMSDSGDYQCFTQTDNNFVNPNNQYNALKIAQNFSPCCNNISNVGILVFGTTFRKTNYCRRLAFQYNGIEDDPLTISNYQTFTVDTPGVVFTHKNILNSLVSNNHLKSCNTP